MRRAWRTAAGTDRTRRAFHVQQPLPVNMCGIAGDVAVAADAQLPESRAARTTTRR